MAKQPKMDGAQNKQGQDMKLHKEGGKEKKSACLAYSSTFSSFQLCFVKCERCLWFSGIDGETAAEYSITVMCRHGVCVCVDTCVQGEGAGGEERR